MRSISFCFLVVVSCLSAPLATPGVAAAADPVPPLKLLFLGDNGHHRPADRFADLAPVLEARGIALKYHDDPAVALTKDTLAAFDGLVIYANIDTITPEQETALLDFVAGGKGLIPLHCASFCFRNSPRYVELVGAQFQKHGGEVFRVENTLPEHPIMKGYGGFESWDETYIHTRHNERDRTVLEYRVQGGQAPGQSREPWTWIRTHGQGRVFYTAWGHDQRTFGHPGFHNLVERGLRWACGQDPSVSPPYVDRPSERFAALPMTAIPQDAAKFEYIEVGPKIPSYRKSERWGEQDPAQSRMQLPLSPAESMTHYSVPQGFRLELFASEPDLQGKPIAMTWDERGRLWVCETVDYPNELQPAGQGRDRIRICEDTDGDGRADEFTVFADQLSIPTSLAFHRGGVIVQDGTETLYLKDTNGDGKADLRQVLVRGWALGDTHGGVSNFVYGLDNWIWAMQGYNNSSPEFGDGQKTSFRQGFFRFRMDQAADAATVADLEFIRSSNNNTWGIGISEEGLIFGSTANRNPSMFMPIPNRYYERVRGWSAEQLGSIADTYLFRAITDKVRQVDQFGGYTAAAGHALYTARNYPSSFWNRTAFVCEPTGHLVGTFALTRDGAGYQSTSPMNLVAADDEWAAPIMAEVGPDGNVWVLDWYNYIVQHNPTPAGFKTGKGNAYESDLRDKKHGRVYRLVYGQQPTATAAPLSADRPQELVAALRRDNLFWRRHAQRLLVERGQDNVVPALLELVRDTSVDAIGLNVGAIHALGTLQGLNVINDQHPEVVEAVFAALKHPSTGVRRNAVQVLPTTPRAVDQLLASNLTTDTDRQVQLAALLALADLPATPQGAQHLAQLSQSRRELITDRWLADALTSAASMHGLTFLEQLQVVLGSQDTSSAGQQTADLIARVAEHLARERPDVATVERVVRLMTTAHPTLSGNLLAGFAKGWPRDHSLTLPSATDAQLVEAFRATSPSGKGQLLRLASAWGSHALDRFAEEIIATFRETALDARLSDDDRAAAVQQLVQFQAQSDAAVTSVLDLISPQTSSDLATRFIAALSGSQSPQVGPALVDRIPMFSPATRTAAVRVLLGRPETTVAFLDAVAAGTLQLSDLSLDQKQALASHPDAALRRRAQSMLRQMGGLPNPDREKVITELLHDVEQKGDVSAGKGVFLKQCAKCHVHSGEGVRIGPDLTGMAVHPKHELLIHILDPSRSVEGNFRVYTVVLNDGRVLTGMLAGESKTAIELIDSEAKRHALSREDIDELVSSRKSLMPEGFEKQIPVSQMRDLLEFLTTRGRYFPLDLSKVATVVSTKGMFHSESSDVERLVFSDWQPKTFEGIPFHLVDPQGDRQPNVVLLNSRNGVIPPRMPKSVSLPCRSPAKAIHLLSGIAGWASPIGTRGSVSMIVRLHYADGTTEDHELKNGIHVADYIRVVDVPESKLAFRLRGQQVRYLKVEPQRADMIDRVEFIKGPDETAPIVMAATVETR